MFRSRAMMVLGFKDSSLGVKCEPRQPSASGFSMMEILAACILIGTAIVAMSRSQISALQLSAVVGKRNMALSLAEMKMTEMEWLISKDGIKAIKESEKGDFDEDAYEGFSWHVSRRMVPIPDIGALVGSMTGASEEETQKTIAGPMKMISEVWAKAVAEVTVEILWGEGEKKKSLDLKTHFIDQEATKKVESMVGGFSAMAKQAGLESSEDE